MKPVFIKLPLIREKRKFYACFSLMQGKLEQIKLHVEKLHPEEKVIYQNYQYNGRKESYLLGRLSAKQAVLGLTGLSNPKSIWIDAGVFLFPIAKGANLQNIQVSISHCDKIGFSIAYQEAHPMGVDVERINLDKKELISSQLTPKEKLLLTTRANISDITAIFSIKEALSKVLKTGLMLDFKFLEVKEIKKKSNYIACTFTNFGQYRAVAFFQKEYVFAIVLPKRTRMDIGPIMELLNILSSNK